MQTQIVVLIGHLIGLVIIASFIYQFLNVPSDKSGDVFVLGYVVDEKQNAIKNTQDNNLKKECLMLLKKLGFGSTESKNMISKAFENYNPQTLEDFMQLINKIS